MDKDFRKMDSKADPRTEDSQADKDLTETKWNKDAEKTRRHVDLAEDNRADHKDLDPMDSHRAGSQEGKTQMIFVDQIQGNADKGRRIIMGKAFQITTAQGLSQDRIKARHQADSSHRPLDSSLQPDNLPVAENNRLHKQQPAGTAHLCILE